LLSFVTENEAQGAIRTNGAVIGQTGTATAFNLKQKGTMLTVHPKEGIAWMEGLFLKNAKILDSCV